MLAFVFPELLFHLDFTLITCISWGSLCCFHGYTSDWEIISGYRVGYGYVHLLLFGKKAKMSLPVHYIRRCLSHVLNKKGLVFRLASGNFDIPGGDHVCSWRFSLQSDRVKQICCFSSRTWKSLLSLLFPLDLKNLLLQIR